MASLTSRAVTIALIIFQTLASVQGVDYSNNCCTALSLALKGKVLYPSNIAYRAFQQGYWSVQEATVTPNCVLAPTSSTDVSIALAILEAANLLGQTTGRGNVCRFAVKGGGHTAQAGSANVEGGVTIDMSGVNAITLSGDQSSVTVGGGQRWGNVYAVLQPLGISVVGGRGNQIGVGGFTLGGGIGYFSTRAGFGCDNVLAFELVLANGTLLTATQASYSDLWLALRGGANNFGIVTAFTLRTWAQGSLWAGNIYYGLATAPRQLQALYDFSTAIDDDPYASALQSFGYSGTQGGAFVNALTYGKPVVNATAFAGFVGIRPQLASTMRITDLISLAEAEEAESPDGFRQLTFGTSFRADLETIQNTYAVWNASIAGVAAIAGITWSLSLEPIGSYQKSVSNAQGGNSLGIAVPTPADTIIITLLSATWNDASDDARIQEASDALLNGIEDGAKAQGTFNIYKDLNHAGAFQKPIDGYGAASKARLQAVSKKYDPFGIFQTAVPGGFKLFAA